LGAPAREVVVADLFRRRALLRIDVPDRGD
jgi:hypothetical protein